MVIEAVGDMLAEDVALGANMPPEFAFIYYGAIADIPAGWIVCDGNNGTPNYLGRYLLGVATAATEPGDAIGATSKTTSGHQHSIQDPGASNQIVSTQANDIYSTTTTVQDTISDIRPLSRTAVFLTLA